MTNGFNPYSAKFVEKLLAAHPDWRAAAQKDPHGFPAPGSVLLEVPSPVPGRALLIRTYGNQVTVDFGPRAWHDHFGEWNGPTDEAVFDVALRFIDDLIAERVVIVTRRFFGRAFWTGPQRVTRLRPPFLGSAEVCSWTGRDATLSRR